MPRTRAPDVAVTLGILAVVVTVFGVFWVLVRRRAQALFRTMAAGGSRGIP